MTMGWLYRFSYVNTYFITCNKTAIKAAIHKKYQNPDSPKQDAA